MDENIINDKFDTLLKNLEPAHKINLNDNMILVKLYNNPVFNGWAVKNGVLPKFKLHHTGDNRTYLGKFAKDGEYIEPQFITIGIIKKSSKKVVVLDCCRVDAKKVSSDIFPLTPKAPSGFVVNGSFYFMHQHITSNIYNSRKMEKVLEKSLELNPIGPYIHNESHRVPITDSAQRDKSTYFAISSPDEKELAEIGQSLSWIQNTLGYLLVKKDNTLDILDTSELAEYNEELKQNKRDNTGIQMLMGNLLMHNSKMIMTPELMTTAIYVGKNLKYKGRTGKLVTLDKKPLTIENIEKLRYGVDRIALEIAMVGKVEYVPVEFHTRELMMPYWNILIVKENPYGYLGAIPPAMPMHASDLNPRTCIMIDNKGNTMVLMVEGRHTSCGGRGIDLFDLAELCKSFGAVSALNIDGGASSRIYWKELGVPLDYLEGNSNPTGNIISFIEKTATQT